MLNKISHSQPPDRSVYLNFIFSYFSTKAHVVGTQKNRLDETVLLNTKNVFKLMDKKIFTQIYTKKCAKPGPLP